jgi:hypothetical protein
MADGGFVDVVAADDAGADLGGVDLDGVDGGGGVGVAAESASACVAPGMKSFWPTSMRLLLPSSLASAIVSMDTP